jgi:hypothetical protein
MLSRKALILAIFSLLMVSTLPATTIPSSSNTIQKMNQIPLSFTKNMGQWDERVLFRANAGGATMWFTKEGITYQFTRRIPSSPSPLTASDEWSKTGERAIPFDLFDNARDSAEQLVLTTKFVGAKANPIVVAEGEMEYKCNYFLGNEPSKWRTDVPNYSAITLKDIYPGIDLKYSDDGTGQVAYKFDAAPGADISQITVAYDGAEKTSIDANGRTIVTTKWGDMIAAMRSPTNDALSGTASFSQLSKKAAGFETSGTGRQALGTFSAELSYSTYLGGGSNEYGAGIAVDGSGNAYITGGTNSSDFPTLNPYQMYVGGGYYGYDVFVTKLSSSGAGLIYSTYLGGGKDDQGLGIAVDDSGNAYVTGFTWSSNFPTLNPYQATIQGGFDSLDAFVTRLSSSGNVLIYSTYLGGTSLEAVCGIAVDGSDCAYVTGSTLSSDFPILNPFQTKQYNNDVFVTKLSNTGNSLIYSTYLGGVEDEIGYGIVVDTNGNAYVTGWTNSYDFPTLNPYQIPLQGYRDAFVTKLSSSGSSLVYSTYLGGGSEDYANGIAVDGNGCAYVTGWTYSSDFPTLNPYQGTLQGGYVDAFVTKLSSSGNGLFYSTYLGGGDYDFGSGIAIDGGGNAYVTGSTGSSNFPTLDPYQSTFQGGNTDVIVAKLSSSGNSLIYSTYLGGGDYDFGSSIAIDGNGNAYVTGGTDSYDFPIENAYQATSPDMRDAFVTKLTRTPKYPCGDVNTDEQVDLLDAVFLINYIFVGGSAPQSLALADVNCSGSINIADLVLLINYIFRSGPAPCTECK